MALGMRRVSSASMRRTTQYIRGGPILDTLVFPLEQLLGDRETLKAELGSNAKLAKAQEVVSKSVGKVATARGESLEA